jgi:hypothetical protein
MKGLWQMIKINYEQMEYLFTGIEDGWIDYNKQGIAPMLRKLQGS